MQRGQRGCECIVDFGAQLESALFDFAEEFLEPQHLGDVRLRGVKPHTDILFVPVEQHAEEAAGDVLDIRHIDAELARIVASEQGRHRFAKQREVGSVPDLHRSQTDHMVTIRQRLYHVFPGLDARHVESSFCLGCLS